MDTLHRNGELSLEDERVLLTAATSAPSLHNSQPWSFDLHDDRLTIYADPSRQLTRTDPAGRSLLISCGAALFNARVAAEHLGFHPRVRLLPDADDQTLVATVRFGRRQVHVAGLAGYFRAVAAARRTNRLPFHDRSIPHAALAGMGEAARAENALLRIYDDPARGRAHRRAPARGRPRRGTRPRCPGRAPGVDRRATTGRRHPRALAGPAAFGFYGSVPRPGTRRRRVP